MGFRVHIIMGLTGEVIDELISMGICSSRVPCGDVSAPMLLQQLTLPDGIPVHNEGIPIQVGNRQTGEGGAGRFLFLPGTT